MENPATLKKKQEIRQGIRCRKEDIDKDMTLDMLQKKLIAAQQKVQELKSQKYPDKVTIARAMQIVAQLEDTLKKEGIQVR